MNCFQDKTSLVTGGAGFIGSNLVRGLLNAGSAVRVLDNLETGHMANINEVLDKIEFIEGDIRNEDDAQRAVAGVDYVFHLGALGSVTRSVQNPILSNQVNVGGTINMLSAARDAGVARFVISSSSSVYGDTAVLPKEEAMAPNPLSPYAIQKLSCEHYCKVFHKLYGLNTFILRYFNVFGPRQDPKSDYAAVIPLFIDAIRAGVPPIIFGNGEQTRDFTFVDDVVHASMCCCSAPESGAAGVYNVARGDRITVNDLAKHLAEILGSDVQPVHKDARPGDVRDSQADSTRAREILGWAPSVEFREGLERTVESFG